MEIFNRGINEDIEVPGRWYDDTIDVNFNIYDESNNNLIEFNEQIDWFDGYLTIPHVLISNLDEITINNYYYYILNDMLYTPFVTHSSDTINLPINIGRLIQLNLDSGGLMFPAHSIIKLEYDENNYLMVKNVPFGEPSDSFLYVEILSYVGAGEFSDWDVTSVGIGTYDVNKEICKFKMYCTDQEDLKIYKVDKGDYINKDTGNGYTSLPDDYQP